MNFIALDADSWAQMLTLRMVLAHHDDKKERVMCVEDVG